MLLAAVAVTSDSTKGQDDDAGEADEEGQATAARAPDASRSSLRIIRVSVDDGGSSPALELVQTIEVGERCSSAQFARGGDVLHIYGAQRWQTFVRVDWGGSSGGGGGGAAAGCCHPCYYPAVSGTPGALDRELERELAELRRCAPAQAAGAEEAKCYNGVGHGEFKKRVIVNKSRPLHRPFNKDKPKKRRRKK